MHIAALRCPYCHHSPLSQEHESLRCTSCGVVFPITHGVINTLIKPDSEVVRELQGMLHEAHERNEPWQTIEELIVRRVPHVTSQQEREDALRDQPKNYYRSTRLNVEQAMGTIDLQGRKSVLEIGGENEFPFLKPFHARGMECFVTNIHFSYDDPEQFSPWVTKVAGDMNRLPFRDGYFDVVLMSATSHHSPDLDLTIGEIARVTRPGGVVLVLNDPIHGVAKHSLYKLRGTPGFAKGGGRTELIHENEYTVGQYRRSFRRHGLRLRASLFPGYYDEKLSSGDVGGVRWSSIARAVSLLWRVRPLRRMMKSVGLPLGHASSDWK